MKITEIISLNKPYKSETLEIKRELKIISMRNFINRKSYKLFYFDSACSLEFKTGDETLSYSEFEKQFSDFQISFSNKEDLKKIYDFIVNHEEIKSEERKFCDNSAIAQITRYALSDNDSFISKKEFIKKASHFAEKKRFSDSDLLSAIYNYSN